MLIFIFHQKYMVHVIKYGWSCPMDCVGRMSDIGVMANHLNYDLRGRVWPTFVCKCLQYSRTLSIDHIDQQITLLLGHRHLIFWYSGQLWVLF